MSRGRWSYCFRLVAFLVFLIMSSESLVKKTTGVLDRFEDNEQAIILLEAYNREWIVSKEELPTGSNLNTWFDIEINSQKTSKEQKSAWKVMGKRKQGKQ